jgi:hypothetical protein
MKVLDIKIMRGPNYWSIRRHKLIQMRLDLEELEQKPTNMIDGFGERLEKMFPTMYGHRCSEGVDGGFFTRVKDGTWMGHVIEHIALEIQCLAGMNCGFGRTRGTGKDGIYNVVFSYMEEKAGVYAAKAAVEIALSLINNTATRSLPSSLTIDEYKEILGNSINTTFNIEVIKNQTELYEKLLETLNESKLAIFVVPDVSESVFILVFKKFFNSSFIDATFGTNFGSRLLLLLLFCFGNKVSI